MSLYRLYLTKTKMIIFRFLFEVTELFVQIRIPIFMLACYFIECLFLSIEELFDGVAILRNHQGNYPIKGYC